MHLPFMQGITFWAPHEAIQYSMQSSLNTVQRDEFKKLKTVTQDRFSRFSSEVIIIITIFIIFTPWDQLENWVATKSDGQVIPNVASEKIRGHIRIHTFTMVIFLLRLKCGKKINKNMESSLTSHIFPKDYLCTCGQVIRYGHYLQ